MKRLCMNFLFLNMSLVCWAIQGQTEPETAALRSFKLAPSYFIGNTASQKTGKRLLDDPQVSAFVQTQNGRIMFTPSGPYIGISLPAEDLAPDKADLPGGAEGAGHFPMQANTRTVVIKAGFSNAHAKTRQMEPRLEEPTSSIVNYMVGSKEDWRSEIPTYTKLVYDDVWEGITLEYLGFMDHLALQLVLEPGSDPDHIVMETGGEKLKLMEDGRLLVSLAGAELVLNPPVAFQNINGLKTSVAVAFKLLQDKSIGFSLGNYAPNFTLRIQPTLTWSTFLGSTDRDEGYKIAVDSQGNAYVSGRTLSTSFPTTSGAVDESYNGGLYDVFVSKLDRSGTALSYSTFLGGSEFESPSAITVDRQGNAYVSGTTFSTDFPTTSGAYDESSNGEDDTFVSKLNSSGTALSYSTLLGGETSDSSQGLAVDPDGNAYVVGTSNSPSFPTTSGVFDESPNGGRDGFVSKLNSSGTALSYSTLLGGLADDFARGIAVGPQGNVYISGSTLSSDFPTTSGTFDESYNGDEDVFVSELNSSGTALSYSTFLGGSDIDSAIGLALDSDGNAYVTGRTSSASYPTTSGAFDESHNGGDDVFVSKLNSSGTALSYATFIGGPESDSSSGIALDNRGNAYVIGSTASASYPTTSGAYDESHNGLEDVMVSMLNQTGTALSYSTFLGGQDSDNGRGIAVSNGSAYITGRTLSTDFPTTSGTYNETHNGNRDVFVSKLNFCSLQLPLWPEINILELVPCLAVAAF